MNESLCANKKLEHSTNIEITFKKGARVNNLLKTQKFLAHIIIILEAMQVLTKMWIIKYKM